MLFGDDVSIFFFNYDSYAKCKSTIYEDTSVDMTDADVEAPYNTAFQEGAEMFQCHLINCVMACSSTFFREPEIFWDILSG